MTQDDFVKYTDKHYFMERRLEELEFCINKVQRQSNQFDDVKSAQEEFHSSMENKIVACRNEQVMCHQKIAEQDTTVEENTNQVDKNS